MLTAPRKLPAYVTLAALVIFLPMLSWQVTFDNLPLVSKVAGWDWLPMSSQPLIWLLTLPLRGLPDRWVPLGLALFSAVCAALTLGVLARSVALLPWERSWGGRRRWMLQMPVLLACGICGLQPSFWQAATTATGETLDLLLLAAPIWCLLEFNASEDRRWLDAATAFWGVGMAQNWAMILAAPAFGAALLWVRGRQLFARQYWIRTALVGAGGFLLCGLLPTFNSIWPGSPWGFEVAWEKSLSATWHVFGELYRNLWLEHPFAFVALSGCFLLPVLPCLLRAREQGSAYVPPAEQLESWVYRLVRAGFLGVCLWLALNPACGPHQLVLRQTGLALPLLTFDYINALGIGFLAGDFLLLFQPAASPETSADFRWQRHPWASLIAFGVLAVLCGGFTTWLAARNGPVLLAANRDSLEGFGILAVRSLPEGRGIMLSDDRLKLAVFEAALSRQGRAGQWLAVDTTALANPEYRAWLERHDAAGWLTDGSRHKLSEHEAVALLEQMSQSNQVCYLHPSFGFFFERFQLLPRGTIYSLVRRGTPAADPPTPGSRVQTLIIRQEAWRREMAPLQLADLKQVTEFSEIESWVSRRLHLGQMSSPRALVLKQWYSASLDAWGVELQQQGKLPQARARFEQALALNPDNFSARMNLRCNGELVGGQRWAGPQIAQAAERYRDRRRLGVLLRQCGPVDNPVLCYALGQVLQEAGLGRQADEQFLRVRALVFAAPPFDMTFAGKIF